ncbi:MAG: hypothetical protein LBS36_11190 [Oscillospiraceae bacterium]|nr:hypothetical protein [Oscillospiraceae bacterium]
MIVLYIFLGILALLALILSVNLIVVVDYDEVLKVHAKWLFLKYPLFPPKKKEQPKTDAVNPEEAQAAQGSAAPPETPQPAAETAPEQPPAREAKKQDGKKKKSKGKKAKNPFLIFYENTGVDGVIDILHRTMDALGGMFRGLYRHFVIRELYIDLTVTGCDAAATAIRYGKVCEKAFPLMGFICANMKVLKYDMEINPDFLGGKDKASYYLVFSMKPLIVLGVLLLAALRLAVHVLLRFILKSRPPKKPKAKKAPPLEAIPAESPAAGGGADVAVS